MNRLIAPLFCCFILSVGGSLYGQSVDSLEVLIIGKRKVLNPGKGYSTTKIDSASIFQNAGDDLSKLLAKETGYYIKTTGPNGLTSVTTRGLSSSHTKLFWNNIPMTTPTLGNTDLSLVPVALFNQISLNAGSAGVINGSGTVGSAINLENSSDDRPGHHFSFLLKSNPTLSGRDYVLGHSFSKKRFSSDTKLLFQKAENDFSFVNANSIDRELLIRENAALERYGIAQNFYWDVCDKSELSYKLMYVDSEKEIPPGIGATNNNQVQLDQIFKNLVAWKYDGNKMYHDIGLAYSSDFSIYTDPVVFINAEFDIKTTSAYYYLSRNISEKLTVGAKFNYDHYDVLSSGFQGNIQQDRLNMFASIAYDYSVKSGVKFSVREEMVDGSTNTYLPSFSYYRYLNLPGTVKFYTNISKNLRLPSLNDLYWENGGNPDLENEESVNYELGIERKSGDWFLNANVYYAYVENWIQWLPDWHTNQWRPNNINNVESVGFELKTGFSINWCSSMRQEIDVNYINNSSKSKSENATFFDGSGLPLIYSPDQNLRVSTAFKFEKWQMRFQQNYTSEVSVNSNNTIFLPRYAPADVSVDYFIKRSKVQYFALGFEVLNVFDEDYHIVANQPMPKRNFALSLQFKL